MFHISIWGAWSFVWRAKPTKAPPWRRDWVQLHQHWRQLCRFNWFSEPNFKIGL